MTDTILKARTAVEEPDTGITERQKLAANLSGLLADTTLLFVKTQAVHWNVVGPLFYGLHTLTEKQYRDLFDAMDAIAERIRALGHPAPASVTEMIPQAQVREFDGMPEAETLIGALADDHEKISSRIRSIVGLAEDQRDVATADLLTSRLRMHEEAVWMLRAILTR